MKNHSKSIFTAILIAYLTFYKVEIFSQIQLNNWKTYTSILDIQTASIDSKGRIWAGTQGGFFVYDTTSKTSRNFTNLDGLLSLNISVIKCIPERKIVLIGTLDGNIEIVNEEFEFTHITDIVTQKLSNPKINDIQVSDSLAYIAGGFGLSILDLNQLVFRESISKLGDFPVNTIINDVKLINGKIWAATDLGIASANINSLISVPDSWNNLTYKNGLPESRVLKLIEFEKEVYGMSKKNIIKILNDTIKIIKNITIDWLEISNIKPIFGKLKYSYQFSIKDVISDEEFYFNSYQINGYNTFGNGDNENVIIFNKADGLNIIKKNKTFESITPNSPYSNYFMNLSNNSGNLWASTASFNNKSGQGIMHLNNDKWENFNIIKYPNLSTDNYLYIHSAANGKIYASSWGFGLLELTPDSDTFKIKIWNNKNSPFTGVANNPDYVPLGEMTSDNLGNLWVVNYGDIPGPVLIAIDKNNNFHTFTNTMNSAQRQFIRIKIDNYNTKWLSSIEGNGLMYYNEMNTLDDKSDDKNGIYNTNNSSILSNNITSFASDKDGLLWIGTDQGLSTFYNPSCVLSGSSAIIKKNNLLGSNYINDVMVDAVNNKWIATNYGVTVLSPDGTIILAQINQTNYPLISNNVFAIATDVNNGNIYFGTKMGLSVASPNFLEPSLNYNIKCFPQPFYPKKEENLIIDGLAEFSTIKILTINGELVKTINTTSRKVAWDGRNEKGEIVDTGIYLISGSSETTKNSSVGKFAVIRN